MSGTAPVCPMHTGATDLVNPWLYRDGEPHEIWRVQRCHEPVSWQQVDATRGFWSVTKLADVEFVLRNHALFTSERGTLLSLLGTDDPAGGRQMAVTDPPRHTRMRDPLQRALSIKRADLYRERIRGIVVELLSPLADGVVDLAMALAALPMAVTGTIMGLPAADWPRLTRLTTAAIAPDDEEFQLGGGRAATLSIAHRELFAYFQDAVAARRRTSDDDLISLLMTMQVDGRGLSMSEIVSNCYSLLLGANVTTPHSANTTIATQVGTGVLEGWAAQPECTVSGTEESLRWASPVNHFMRYATRDLELHGVPIQAGDAVVVWLGSANRDEDVFDDPYRFDIRRRPNKHIAFGSGAHYCVGHSLARVTLRVFFAELLSRFTDIAVVGTPQRLCSNFIAGYKHLPITAQVRTPPGPVGY